MPAWRAFSFRYLLGQGRTRRACRTAISIQHCTHPASGLCSCRLCPVILLCLPWQLLSHTAYPAPTLYLQLTLNNTTSGRTPPHPPAATPTVTLRLSCHGRWREGHSMVWLFSNFAPAGEIIVWHCLRTCRFTHLTFTRYGTTSAAVSARFACCRLYFIPLAPIATATR